MRASLELPLQALEFLTKAMLGLLLGDPTEAQKEPLTAILLVD